MIHLLKYLVRGLRLAVEVDTEGGQLRAVLAADSGAAVAAGRQLPLTALVAWDPGEVRGYRHMMVFMARIG